MKEEWRNVVGYEALYEVSNKGNVRSCDRHSALKNGKQKLFKGKDLKKRDVNSGYLVVSLTKNKETKQKLVHRLVAESFIPNEDIKPYVNHIDTNRANANVKNLEWCTHLENMTHKMVGLDSNSNTNFGLYIPYNLKKLVNKKVGDSGFCMVDVMTELMKGYVNGEFKVEQLMKNDLGDEYNITKKSLDSLKSILKLHSGLNELELSFTIGKTTPRYKYIHINSNDFSSCNKILNSLYRSIHLEGVLRIEINRIIFQIFI